MSEDGVVIPASYLFEVPEAAVLLKELDTVRQAGLFRFASETPDLLLYASRKRHEYREEMPLFSRYQEEGRSLIRVPDAMIWVPRVGSASGTIANEWRQELANREGLWAEILARPDTSRHASMEEVERAIASVPERLDGRAFILRFAKPLLPISLQPSAETRLQLLISRAYLQSYLDELGAVVLCDTRLGDLDCQLPRQHPSGGIQTVSWRVLHDWFETLGVVTWIEERLTWGQLIRLRTHPVLTWLLTWTVLGTGTAQAALQSATRRAGFDATRFRAAIPRRSGKAEIVSDQLWRFHATVEPFLRDVGDGIQAARPARRRVAPLRRGKAQMGLPVDLREKVGLVILIALDEEFREFWELLTRQGIEVLGDVDGETRLTVYRFSVRLANGEACHCVAIVTGQMGPTVEGVVTERARSRWNARAFVSLGIAAALSVEVKVGDVVAATAVDLYIERSKAVDSAGSSGFDLEFSGEAYRPTRELSDACRSVEFAHGDVFVAWREACQGRLMELVSTPQHQELRTKELIHEGPKLVCGHVASGPTVGASEAFKNALKKRDRAYVALDMEAGGMLAAMDMPGAPSPSLVLRGISDFGDTRKKELDQVGRGGLRRYAMHSASRYLLAMVEVGAFER